MRAAGRLGRQGWRGVAAVAFAATAVLAVTVSRAAPAHLALTSARHPSRAHGASGAPRCATSRLRISLSTGAGPGTRASAGHGSSAGASVRTLDFTNVSGTACALSGYPAVAAYGTGGAQIGNAAGRDTSVTARRIVLAPGATAHAIPETLVNSSVLTLMPALRPWPLLAWVPGPEPVASEMRSRDVAHCAAPRATSALPGCRADVSATCPGPPRLTVTASTAVAANATAATPRQPWRPRRPDALIVAPLRRSALVFHLYPVTTHLPRPAPFRRPRRCG